MRCAIGKNTHQCMFYFGANSGELPRGTIVTDHVDHSLRLRYRRLFHRDASASIVSKTFT